MAITGKGRRVELAVGGVARQRGGQVRVRGGDGRLHVARRAVDVPVDAEGQLDAGGPHAAGGCHVIDIGNGAQVPLQRRRHGARHDLRTRPRQLRGDEYGRHIDARQRRHRQQVEGYPAAQRHPRPSAAS